MTDDTVNYDLVNTVLLMHLTAGQDTIEEVHFWTGAALQQDRSSIAYTGGTPVEAWNYTNWAVGQPKLAYADAGWACMLVVGGGILQLAPPFTYNALPGHWYIYNCSAPNWFFCQGAYDNQ